MEVVYEELQHRMSQMLGVQALDVHPVELPVVAQFEERMDVSEYVCYDLRLDLAFVPVSK